MTMPAVAPGPNEDEATDREEAMFRGVMLYVTDQLWTLRIHEFGMAVLHDILDFAISRREAQQDRHERLPES
jgi:hypothetical protein